MLEDHGHSVNTEKRRFSTLLIPKAAFPKLWVPNLANLATTLLLESSRYIPLQAVCQLKPEEALPSGGSSEIARDLSGLLLRDVEIGTLTLSRIEDAIHFVQKFIQLARIGLEVQLDVT
jgi:hypothetical protein